MAMGCGAVLDGSVRATMVRLGWGAGVGPAGTAVLGLATTTCGEERERSDESAAGLRPPGSARDAVMPGGLPPESGVVAGWPVTGGATAEAVDDTPAGRPLPRMAMGAPARPEGTTVGPVEAAGVVPEARLFPAPLAIGACGGPATAVPRVRSLRVRCPESEEIG